MRAFKGPPLRGIVTRRPTVWKGRNIVCGGKANSLRSLVCVAVLNGQKPLESDCVRRAT